MLPLIALCCLGSMAEDDIRFLELKSRVDEYREFELFPVKSFVLTRESTRLPGVKWYADGYGTVPYSLTDADNVGPCGKSFREVMRVFCTKVVRGYWHHLGLQRLQQKCPFLEKVPLGVRLALSFILHLDVTECSAVDIHHFLVDLFSVTPETMLDRPAYLEFVDQRFWYSDVLIESQLLSASPEVIKLGPEVLKLSDETFSC